MKTNPKLHNLMLFFGICGDDEINSYNMYLGRLYELKLELEDALDECQDELSNVLQEKKPF